MNDYDDNRATLNLHSKARPSFVVGATAHVWTLTMPYTERHPVPAPTVTLLTIYGRQRESKCDVAYHVISCAGF